MGIGSSEGLWVALRAVCPSLGSVSLRDLRRGWGFCLEDWRSLSVRESWKISGGPLGAWGPAEGSQPRRGDWGPENVRILAGEVGGPAGAHAGDVGPAEAWGRCVY